MYKPNIIKDSRSSHNRVSKYTGVKWLKESSMWQSYLIFKRVNYICGMFSDDRDAAKARDIKIISLGINKPLQVLKRT
jgi:hypothetical protein